MAIECPICSQKDSKPPSKPVICPICGKVVYPKENGNEYTQEATT